MKVIFLLAVLFAASYSSLQAQAFQAPEMKVGKRTYTVSIDESFIEVYQKGNVFLDTPSVALSYVEDYYQVNSSECFFNKNPKPIDNLKYMVQLFRSALGQARIDELVLKADEFFFTAFVNPYTGYPYEVYFRFPKDTQFTIQDVHKVESLLLSTHFPVRPECRGMNYIPFGGAIRIIDFKEF